LVNNTERYWWAEALLAVLAFIGMLVFAIRILLTMPQVGPIFTADERNQEVGLAILVAVVGVGSGMFFLAVSLRDWRRMRRRWAALRGDLSAMPLSRFIPDASKVPDVSAKPLELSWRATRSSAYVYGAGILIEVLVSLVVLVGLPAWLWFVLITGKLAPLTFDPGNLAAYAYLILGPIGGVVLVIVTVRLLPWLFGRPFGLAATTSGIEQRTELGGKRSLRWEDMRLFEVETAGLADTVAADRFYCVHGGRSRVQWRDPPGQAGQHKPVGITADEMARRHTLLLNLIYARTGLAPRTLTKSLQAPASPETAAQAPQAPPRTRNARSTWAAALFILVLAALTAGAAVAAVMLPASPVQALNLLIALSLALSTLALWFVTGWIVVRFVAGNREYPPPQAPVVTAPALGGPLGARTLTYRLTPLVRVALFLGGALLLPNIVPGLLVFGSMIADAFRPATDLPAPTPIFAPLLDILLLFFYGGSGLLLVTTAIRLYGFEVRAVAQGISRGLGRQVTNLRWDGVERLVGRTRNGRIIAYLVTGELGKTQVGWSAGATWYLRITTPPGGEAITPDEMAALVARESGQPLRIEPAP
jgi:hypothetical protein